MRACNDFGPNPIVIEEERDVPPIIPASRGSMPAFIPTGDGRFRVLGGNELLLANIDPLLGPGIPPGYDPERDEWEFCAPGDRPILFLPE